MNSPSLVTVLLLFVYCSAAEAAVFDDSLGDVLTDYAWNGAKILLACSPILFVAAVLMFSSESEEEEKAKREEAQKASCKS